MVLHFGRVMYLYVHSPPLGDIRFYLLKISLL